MGTYTNKHRLNTYKDLVASVENHCILMLVLTTTKILNTYLEMEILYFYLVIPCYSRLGHVRPIGLVIL